MNAGAFLDKVKNAFSIGTSNRWLFGNGGQPQDDGSAYEGYEESSYEEYYDGTGANPYAQQAQGYGYQAPYNQGYQEQAYSQPNVQQPYAQPNYAQANYSQPNYNNPSYTQQGAYRQQQDFNPESVQEQAPQFQSQFAPEGFNNTKQQRNRRADQHRERTENVVPFPEENTASAKSMDAYVINVNNVAACRQAMMCLRKGQCAIIVMDRLTDRSETRRYVDMLTGACYALGGTMTRLSSKIGFYLMAPSNMTVYTDAVTSNANNPKQAAENFTQPQPSAQMPFNANTAYRGAQQANYGNPYSNMQAEQMSQQMPPQNHYYGQNQYEAPAVSSSVHRAYYSPNEMAQ
ncbi:MAG: cell division protein SepF [Eubacteriales bacterium]|nr:cell division protein SepF [Eubacteriales bacterium]